VPNTLFGKAKDIEICQQILAILAKIAIMSNMDKEDADYAY
jgi:hypothetical protein